MEEAAFETSEAEQWDEDQDDEGGGVEDAGADFAGGGGDDFEAWFWLGAGGVFAESAEDIFDIDDGVIDDHADGDGDAAEGHAVDADAEPFEGEQGDGEGERDGC